MMSHHTSEKTKTVQQEHDWVSPYPQGMSYQELDRLHMSPQDRFLTYIYDNEQENAITYLKEHPEFDVNYQDSNGYPPLHIATQYLYFELVEELLKHHAEIHFVDKNANSALHYGCSTVSTKISQLLLDNGADIHAKNAQGETPLFVAAIYGITEQMDFLVSRGAYIHTKNKKGDTILIAVAKAGKSYDTTPGLSYFLEKGLDPNAKNMDGNTALHYCVQNADYEGLALLLKYGANPLIKNNKGQTVLDCFKESAGAFLATKQRDPKIEYKYQKTAQILEEAVKNAEIKKRRSEKILWLFCSVAQLKNKISDCFSKPKERTRPQPLVRSYDRN